MKDINYEIGITYARSGDYENAKYYLTKSSNSGNFRATNDLGVVYEKMELYKEALHLYMLAACTGNAIAIYNVANMFENGMGVKQNLNTAFTMYKYSAQRGYTMAYKKLAKFYHFGIGRDKDESKTIYYLTKGMELEKRQKYPTTDCTNLMAYNYNEGIGVKADRKKAFELWNICAEHNDINAIYNIAICYLYGEVVKKDTDKALRTLIDLACKYNYKGAINMLSIIYDSDEFGMKDTKEAGHWLIEGAKATEIHCLLNLAEICLSGKQEEYCIGKDFSKEAIYDFLLYIDGKHDEYSDELEDYNELKAKYSDKLDWEYLETLPDNNQMSESNTKGGQTEC